MVDTDEKDGPVRQHRTASDSSNSHDDVNAPVPEMVDHALGYARAGLPVFPLVPREKRPLVEHGKDDATVDLDQIAAWWRRWPNANIAIRPPLGYVVLDVDPRSGGTLDGLGALPKTMVAATGGGGWHCWFRCTGKMRGRLDGAPGIDIKTNTGYLVAPPSVHPSGRRYEWVQRAPVSYLPARLRDRVLQPERRTPPQGWHSDKPTVFSGLITAVATAPQGQRNHMLFWAFCSALNDRAGEDVLRDIATAAAANGLSDREIESTRRSAERRVAA